jgi:hypothetical protein
LVVVVIVVAVLVVVVTVVLEVDVVGSRGSSVSIMSNYGLDDRRTEVRSPIKTKGFLL